MSRTRDVAECPDCKKALSYNQQGRLVCDCPGKHWQLKPGIAGSPEERALLERHGWQLIEKQNDNYWAGPFARILYLYEDDTWFCDTAPERFRTELNAYIEWYSDELRKAGLK